MQIRTTIRCRAIAMVAPLLVGACGGNTPADPSDPADAAGPTTTGSATGSGVVKAATGAAVAGASVKVGAATATTGADAARASWLPSRESALGWQRMAGGTAVVSAC